MCPNCILYHDTYNQVQRSKYPTLAQSSGQACSSLPNLIISEYPEVLSSLLYTWHAFSSFSSLPEMVAPLIHGKFRRKDLWCITRTWEIFSCTTIHWSQQFSWSHSYQIAPSTWYMHAYFFSIVLSRWNQPNFGCKLLCIERKNKFANSYHCRKKRGNGEWHM